ncbi:MAG: GDP-L-fucose synthase family protein [Stenotrophobium sp.]
MHKDAKIYIAGHRGLAGSALMRQFRTQGHRNLITRSHSELDLTNANAVRSFFRQEQPEYVFLAAAKVGGIHANNTYPAEFIQRNLAIQTHVIHEAWLSGVRHLLFLGSSCIYPRDCPQPIREEYLLTGPLEPTNRPYALAKIAGIEMCWAYNRQYGTQYIAAMPTNLYGPGDNYDLKNSHVLPALIRKCHEAKVANAPSITAWGTGTPRREFLYSDDMADACIFLMQNAETRCKDLFNDERPPLLNVGCGEDVTIAELLEIVKQVVGYAGKTIWDSGKPDGTRQKLLDISRLIQLGWRPKISLGDGLTRTYAEFAAAL